ncbi:MAG: hypothetical protein ACKO25_00015 [Cyanobium sp.]
MPEASREPLSDTTSPRSTSSFDGINSQVLSLAGYSLLAFSLYNVLSALLIGGFASGPEITLNRITQLLSIYPLLLLGPALIFAPHGARRLRSLWPELVRWLVFLLAVMYLLFVPVTLFNQFSLVQRDANQVKRLEASLGRRKQEILRAVDGLQSPDAFRGALSRFPEVTSITIAPGESPAAIRRGISGGIDQSIAAEIDRVKQVQARRLREARSAGRSLAVGNLIAGVSLLALASYLLPWLEPLGKSLTHTLSGFTKAFQKWMRRFLKGRSRRPGRG